MFASLPPRFRRYVTSHTRRGSKMRKQLVELLYRLCVEGKVRYSEVKNLGVRYHVDKLRKLGLLKTVKDGKSLYIVVEHSASS